MTNKEFKEILTAFKIIFGFMLVFIVIFLVSLIVRDVRGESKKKPLSVEIFENNNIKSIKIWRNISQIDTLYSVDINDNSWDDLTLDSLKIVIREYSIKTKQNENRR